MKKIIPITIGITILVIVIIIGIINIPEIDKIKKKIILDNAFNYQTERVDYKSHGEILLEEATEIIHKRDCKEFTEWWKNNHYSIRKQPNVIFLDDIIELDNYNKYCQEPDTVLDDNGIDIEDNWYYQHIWDRHYERLKNK